MLEADETVKPPKIQDALEALRLSQKEFVDKRNDLVVSMGDVNPEEQTLITFERWVAQVEELRDDIDEKIEDTLEDCKQIFSGISDMIFEEEKKLYDDLTDMIDMSEVEEFMTVVQEQVNSLIDLHYMDLRELSTNFEDLSLRSAKQMAICGKLYSELVQTWTVHKASFEERKHELALELDETRKEFDENDQQVEAQIDIRIDDLRKRSYAFSH